MTYRGVVKGKTIELEEPVPYPQGHGVVVSIEPITNYTEAGSPVRIRAVMHEPPRLDSAAVDDLDRSVEAAKFAVRPGGTFDVSF